MMSAYLMCVCFFLASAMLSVESMSAAQKKQAREKLCVEAPPAVQAAHRCTPKKEIKQKEKMGATSCALALSAQPITDHYLKGVNQEGD
jgi:hypothetical protein